MTSRTLLPAIFSVLLTATAWTQSGPGPDLGSDTWTATDALGRTLPGYEECGPPRDGKTVGIFYFTWHGQHSTSGPHDITRILAENPDDPQWGPVHAMHHWGEPEDGYYIADDEYVIRKSCNALTDAGVDVIIIDVTNAVRYTNIYMKICEVYAKIRAEGGQTPQMCFIANAGADQVVSALYDEFYGKDLYPDLWFRWQGKPLILAQLTEDNPVIRDFFTVRKSWAWNAGAWFGDGHHSWCWLDHYPQEPGWDVPGVPEQISVSVAQHATTNIGRSFHDGKQPEKDAYDRSAFMDQGLCFAEQWERALEVDPAFVFVTGWNEWTAMRFLSDGTQPLVGAPVPEGGSFFVDAYTQEYSRDIEPMKDGYTDNYYYQLVANVRRYKGVSKPPVASGPKTIDIDGTFVEWADVAPEYLDHRGDTFHRDHPGQGDTHYTNTTGRNDIVAAKVAQDPDNLYFLVECADDLSPATGLNWMLLFIDADQNPTTGWEGYDVVVNRTPGKVEATTDGWNWAAAGDARLSGSGKALEVAIPKSVHAGLASGFDFKWADHIQKDDDIIEFSVSGDAAPNRRFNYRYTPAEGKIMDTWDTMSDTWVATDGLGRAVATHKETGPPREDKQIGMFYFLWLGMHGQSGPHDITRILAGDPNAMAKDTSPPWGPLGAYHHWAEPLFGYYLSDDEWVYRKHAQMLSDAGVDCVIFDTTNRATYNKSYMALCRAWDAVRRNGGKTPQIAFLTPFGSAPETVQEIYDDLYGPGLFPDLWYRWEGKPLIMAWDQDLSPELKAFFTIRNPIPGYRTGPSGPNQWAWLECYPQNVYYTETNPKEQMVVGVAQNCTKDKTPTAFSVADTYGRSWHDGAKDTRPGAVNLGLNFAEQWERAFEVDPSFIFVTGWNEWVAMRLAEFNGMKEPAMFVDMYTQEYSRDLEPMKGGHGDAYYYQFVDYARKYKGTRPAPKLGPLATIALGDFTAWPGIQPSFRDDIGDTAHRNHPGWGEAGPYVNNTGRNDLVEMKVAHDAANLYFYARTGAAITPHTDPYWMMLFINANRSHESGWEGYDFVVNRKVVNEEKTTLEQSARGWNWETLAEVDYRVQGSEIMVVIPRKLLGLEGKLDFEFKWADNMAEDDNALAFITNGDAAPNGRFNYLARE